MDEHFLRVTGSVYEANDAFLAVTVSLLWLAGGAVAGTGGLEDSLAELLSLLRRAQADLEAIYFTAEQEEHARAGG